MGARALGLAGVVPAMATMSTDRGSPRFKTAYKTMNHLRAGRIIFAQGAVPIRLNNGVWR